MASGKQIAGVLIGLTIVMSMFAPFVGVITSSTGSQTVNNTSFSANVGETTDLPGYDVDQSSVTVQWYNASSGSWETVGSSEYDFKYEEGAIVVSNGTEISTGDDMTASYTYQATSGTTTTIIGLTPLFMGLLVLVILANNTTDMM